MAGDEAVRDFGDHFNSLEFFDSLGALGVEESAFIESIEVLHDAGYVRLPRTMRQGLPSMRTFTLTTFGLEPYAHRYVSDYRRAGP